MQQKMAPLPAFRLKMEAPFYHCGVDVFGPFRVRYFRKAPVRKNLLLFTCMQTRAVHLEILDGMKARHFFQALKRMQDRRPFVRYLYSDNGTNFEGADRVMREAMKEWQDAGTAEYVRLNVSWERFSRPAAHHEGGPWERMIRSTRKILYSLLGSNPSSFEDFQTIVIGAEGILNRRPLTKATDDINDPRPLSPMDALCPNAIRQAEGTLGDLPEPTAALMRETWQGNLDILQAFKSRFMREYIPFLQQRQKWNKSTKNPIVGQLVLLIDETKKRRCWKTGIVRQVEGTSPHLRGVHVAIVTDADLDRVSDDPFALPKTSTYYRSIDSVVSLEADLD